MKSKHLILIFLFILFAATRLVNLMKFPMFLDEAIYFRWLETIKANPSQWLLPLKEFGWAPLTTWIATLASFIVKDSLLALRLTAVFFGGLSVMIAYKTAKILFNKPAAFLICLLIITAPIVLIHDRLGLRGDSAVTFVSLLTLFGLSKRLLLKQSKASYIIGLAIALGLLIKSTAWVLAPLVALSFLIFRTRLSLDDLKASLLPALSALFYLSTNSFTAFANKSSVFLLPSQQVASFLKPNLIQLALWSHQYLTWPVLILMFIGAAVTFKTKIQTWKLIALLTLPTVIFVTLFAKIFFPRYLLATAVLGMFTATAGLAWIFKKIHSSWHWAVALIFLLPSLLLDFYIVKDIKLASNLPEIEKWQYVTGWPSGYAVVDLINYLKTDSPSILISESNDLIASSLNYYWPDHSIKQLQLDEAYILNTELPFDQKTYLILNEASQLPDHFSGELISQFFRPENKSSLRLYEIN